MNNYGHHHLESSNAAEDFADTLATLPTNTFPYKLQQMLDNSANDERMEAIISWLPNNRSFKVHDQNAFVTEVLPQYFFKITKWKSFLRQLNNYGFERTCPLRGGYCHKNFIRGEPRYCMYITRHQSRFTRVNKKKGDLRMFPENANIAMQAPAALSNKNTIDIPDDGDLLMFHGKTFHYLSLLQH